MPSTEGTALTSSRSLGVRTGSSVGRLVRRGATAYAGVTTVLVALIAILSATQPTFSTYANFVNILETNAVLLVVAVGLTLVLLVGGFDLSVGGLLALTGVLLAKLIAGGVPVGLAIAVVVVGGVAVGGLTNGFMVARLKLSFFVVTLGTMTLFRGLALVATGGETQGLYTQTFLRGLGSGRIGAVPYSVLIALAVLAAAWFVTRYTGYGRMLYAVGGNSEAARLAGINVVAIRLSAFAICSGLAALAGVMEAGRLAAASPTTASGIELTAAAAVLLGGTSFVGGSGGMLGTFLGALFLGVLANGLTIAGISSFWQGVIAGLVLVAAVLVDKLRRTTS